MQRKDSLSTLPLLQQEKLAASYALHDIILYDKRLIVICVNINVEDTVKSTVRLVEIAVYT